MALTREQCAWNDFMHGWNESHNTEQYQGIVNESFRILQTESSRSTQGQYARGIVAAGKHVGIVPTVNPPATESPVTFVLKMYSGKRGTGTFRSMTRMEVLQLGYGDHCWFHTFNGDAREVKINGQVRTWKRQPDRIEVSVKYGMYEYSTIHTANLHRFLILVSQ
jgi:hypothetical protein